jgi:hypothetical protein
LRLLAANAANPGSPCEGTYGGLLLLGEVSYCAPVQDGYEIWLDVEQSLEPRSVTFMEVPETLGAHLVHLNERLLERSRPAPRAVEGDCAGKRL